MPGSMKERAAPPSLPPEERNRRAFAWLRRGGEAERREDWASGVDCYGAALDLGPVAPELRYFGHNNLAYCLIRLTRFDTAEPHCRAAIEVDPGRHNAHKNLGLVRQGQDRPAEAAACFATAFRLCPSDVRA